jgi:hypothetical protein
MELAARVYAAQRASDTGDPATAEAHLTRAMAMGRGMSPIFRTIVASETAWLRVQGDLAGARAEAETGIAALSRTRFGRACARDRELLEGLRASSAR